WKPLLALVVLAAAFGLPRFFHNGLGIDIDPSQRAQAARGQDPYDATELRVLTRAALEVSNHYVEPDRIDYQRMLLSGLNAIQRSVAPVMVDYSEGQNELAIQVHDQRRTFSAEVDSPWSLSTRFGEVFEFLQTNLRNEDIELHEVEYTAVNGMLRTLDPHTVLLTPDVFEEMQMSTRGEFGGLGIVISIRDGHLTVIRPMPGTPAERAGLQRGDRVVKIEDESTLNMPLTEAVDRLRGPPGSPVRVWIQRRGENGRYGAERRVELVRARIHIDSVDHRMLGDNVGYISINNFQGNTHEDLMAALADLHRQDLQGLVLDLRNNPGGLLDQAVRISDTFLSSGTIVTTSSPDPRQQDQKFAHGPGTEPNYPMVVLVNGSSASASEIVAGALKNHDRALIIGQRSFGKGSVQVLNNFQDGSALKLTIAQYLTPGEVSIQGVGILPDIGIDPMTVDAEDMDLEIDPDSYLRESDLRSALTNERTDSTDGPDAVLRYYLSGEDRQRLREADAQDTENEEEEQFLLRFARELVANAQRPGRREMLEDAQAVINAAREREMGAAIAELRRLGVDWSEGADEGASNVQVEVSTSAPNNTTRAGEPFQLRVRVTNTGEHPLYRLRAVTESANQLFDDRELVFGRVAPGETREWTATLGVCKTEENERVCRVPRDTPDRADGITVNFSELHDHAPEPAEIRTTVRALPRPVFAYSVHVADDVRGNGDGVMQRGERGSLYLHVRNSGDGPSYETHANLRNLSGRGILLRAGRFRIDNIAPGEERVVKFGFEVLNDFARNEAKLEISLIDTDLREAITEKVILPLPAAGGTAPEGASGSVRIADGTVLRVAPLEGADPVGTVVGGELVSEQSARVGAFVRVALEDGEPAWVPASSVTGGRGRSSARIEFAYDHRPPSVEIAGNIDLVTRNESIVLRGSAQDDVRVRDLYIFAGARKVYYQANAEGGNRLNYEATVPLHGGINYVTVFARESDDVISRRTMVIRRDGPNGQLLETPRYDDGLFGSSPH
ncbi:MAG: MXAN_5808 family serine peptidase, partial [Myxococcota bacterium]